LVTLPVNRETAEIVGTENVLEVFFRPYSEKMWGMRLEEISPDILNRVKVRDDDNDLYFPDDVFQKMPKKGYTEMCNNLLNAPLISMELNKSDRDIDLTSYAHVFHSGAIDEFFENRFGPLPYRSIKFTTHHLPIPKIFPVSVVNFTHHGAHTRIVEWKNFPMHGSNDAWTTVTYEEPCDYLENNGERFYPVKDANGEYRALYKRYLDYAQEKYPYITFCGRLGNYAYLDMHQAVNSAIKIAEKYIKNENSK
jgi:UDP-galactopyranose mutase